MKTDTLAIELQKLAIELENSGTLHKMGDARETRWCGQLQKLAVADDTYGGQIWTIWQSCRCANAPLVVLALRMLSDKILDAR